MNPEISLTLTLAQVNVILQALAQGPYATVEPVISAIRAQAQPQVEAAETAA